MGERPSSDAQRRRAGVPTLVGRDLGSHLVSYSQNAEDVRLWRVFQHERDGFYVDVGASHPSEWSVTKLFYDAGWSGVNIEPGPVFDLLVAERPRDANIRAVISARNESREFWLTHPHLGMSTLEPDVHANVSGLIDAYEKIVVDGIRLEDVLARHARGRIIHFLKIDVEGSEAEVIASNDWRTYRPIVIVVEAVAPLDSTPTHEAWEPTLLDAGYEFAAFDGLNRFYVAGECSHLKDGLAYPIGVLDNFITAAHAGLEVARNACGHDQGGTLTDSEAMRTRIVDLTSQLRAVTEERDAILASRTWRAGRIAWHLASPLMNAARRVRKRAG